MDKATVEAVRNGGLVPAERKLALNLALASRMLSIGGHDDLNQGQVSARLPGSDRFVIKGATRGFNEARPTDMLVCSVDITAPVDPLAPPELPLHQAIYAARPDVNAVVHSHAPATILFGALGWQIRPVSHDGACFVDRLATFSETSNTVLTMDTGVAVASAMGDAIAVLLQNHGGVIVGKSIKHSTILAQLLERACSLQIMAESTGKPYETSTETDVQAKQDYVYGDQAIRTYWDWNVRAVRSRWPDTADWT